MGKKGGPIYDLRAISVNECESAVQIFVAPAFFVVNPGKLPTLNARTRGGVRLRLRERLRAVGTSNIEDRTVEPIPRPHGIRH